MPAPSDLVHQTSSSTGTGNLTLVSVNGKRSFATAFGTGATTNVFDYFISNRNAAEWERGTGHMSNGTTLVRDTVLASSNSNTAVSFTSGTLDVVNDVPAGHQLTTDTAGSLPTLTLTACTLSGTFTGSGGAALFSENVSVAAASSTSPEVGAQFTMTSAVGLANQSSAYKIALTASVVATSNSANIYGFNSIVQGYAGSGGILITAAEFDLNNLGANANTIGGSTAAYGAVSVAAGSYESTAGFWATASVSGKWTYGFAASNTNASSIKEAGFYDASSSTRVLYATGTHTTGIDFGSATLTYAALFPNNVPLTWKDSGGTVRSIIKLNASNIIEVGDAGISVGLRVVSNTQYVGFQVHNGTYQVGGIEGFGTGNDNGGVFVMNANSIGALIVASGQSYIGGGGLAVGTTTTSSATWLKLAAGTAARSQLNLPDSTAPTSPANGDLWVESGAIKFRTGGTTKTVTIT